MPIQLNDANLHLDKTALSSKKTTPSTNPADTPQATNQSSPQQARKQAYNVAILQANQEVSLSIKNEPLALIYKTAIEAINEELSPELGENAIEKGYESGLDVSPEATSGRILSFSLGLFSLYQQQHPELNEQEQAEKFVGIIGGGIDTGFSEAREILDGLGVLKDEIAENIDKTYDLIQDGLIAFREKYELSENKE